MSSYVWCHGTNCHKSHTLDRVRGSKGSKVLRTKRIKQETEREWYSENDIHNYFCSQGCLMDFMRANIQRLLALAPRTEPLETPINDPEKTQDYYGWKITERGVDTSVE